MFFTFRKLLPTSNESCLIRFVSAMADILKPPETVRGITNLDKNLFQKTLRISYLSLTDVNLSALLPVVKKYLLKLDNFKPIQHEVDKKITIFFNPQNINEWNDFPTETHIALKSLSIGESNLKNKDVTLKYENFSAENILKAVLPCNKEGRLILIKNQIIVTKVFRNVEFYENWSYSSCKSKRPPLTLQNYDR